MAHLRHPRPAKRHRCKNRVQYAGSQQRRVHLGNLYPCHKQGAGTGSGKDGKLTATGDLTTQKHKTEGEPSQSALLTAPPKGEPRETLRFCAFLLPLPMGEVARR